jgi:hypothetical protein
MDSSGLLTRWIDAEGAQRIMVEAGILEHEVPVPEFSTARPDRETYLHSLRLEVAYAVASRSASSAAPVPGSEEEAYFSHMERLLAKWAKTSASELEELKRPTDEKRRESWTLHANFPGFLLQARCRVESHSRLAVPPRPLVPI